MNDDKVLPNYYRINILRRRIVETKKYFYPKLKFANNFLVSQKSFEFLVSKKKKFQKFLKCLPKGDFILPRMNTVKF